MTYRYGLILIAGILAFILLYSNLIGYEISKNFGLLTSGLVMPYLLMFDGMWRKEKIDSITQNLPLSFSKLYFAKIISFYIYLAFATVVLFIVMYLEGNDMQEGAAALTWSYGMIYVVTSLIGKIVWLRDKHTFVNLPNLAYMILGIAYFVLLIKTNIFNYVENSANAIPINLFVLLVFTAFDFGAAYLNRNRLTRA
jgi:hypothetical protein